MKNSIIVILGLVVVVSVGYIFKLKNQLAEDKILMVKSDRVIDSLSNKILDEKTKQGYLEAIADRNLAQAERELEATRKKKK